MFTKNERKDRDEVECSRIEEVLPQDVMNRLYSMRNRLCKRKQEEEKK